MLAALFCLLAQQDAGEKPAWVSFVPFLLIIGVVFFMMTRSMRRQEKERQAMASSLEKNDRVLTAAGIYGTVVSISDKEDEIVVRVYDNTRLRMTKASVVRNLTREETLKAQQQQKKA